MVAKILAMVAQILAMVAKIIAVADRDPGCEDLRLRRPDGESGSWGVEQKALIRQCTDSEDRRIGRRHVSHAGGYGCAGA
jgi:hypothetical protein